MKPALVWVDVMLSQWGRRMLRGESGAIGFASSCLLAVSGCGDGYDSSIPKGVSDGYLDECDEAVMRLPVDPYASAVVAVYVVGAGQSDEINARRVGVSRRTLEKYIQTAQRMIALDIDNKSRNNSQHSVIGEISPERIKPDTARA
jgi:hypothetical protein